MGVKLEGVKELRAALESHANVTDVARPIVKYHGAQLQQNAQRNAPVKTGTLKRSIRLDIKDNGMTAEVAATTDYAAYVEYGTRYMDAQPYMGPAYNQQVDRFIRDLNDALDQ